MDAAPDQALIALEGITKVYGRGEAEVRALDGVDLSIRHGEFVAVMGPSGSGKSTVMNILGYLDTQTAGRYLFDGVPVQASSRQQRTLLRRNFIGFIFQGYNLLAQNTAIENVELPLIYRGIGGRERRALAERALDRVVPRADDQPDAERLGDRRAAPGLPHQRRAHATRRRPARDVLRRVRRLALDERQLGDPGLLQRLVQVLGERGGERGLLLDHHPGDPVELAPAPFDRARAPGREGRAQRGDAVGERVGGALHDRFSPGRRRASSWP